MGCRDIYASVETLRANGLRFMPAPPATYYEKVDARVPGHGEDVAQLKANGVLIDGEGAVKVGDKEGTMTKVLLQIFSAHRARPDLLRVHPAQGRRRLRRRQFPRAVESIEEDQIRRGVLKPAA